jgi:integrase
MTKLRWLRKKVAKGRTYYYFAAGNDSDGRPVLTKLPDIKDPRFGDCYARAVGVRTQRKNRQGMLTFDGLVRAYEKSPAFKALSHNSQVSYSRYLARANQIMRFKTGESIPVKLIERKDIVKLRDDLAHTPGAANQVIRSLGALFAWAIDDERVKESPVRNIKKFAAKPHEPWPQELLEEALRDPQVGDAAALLYFSGQRIDDVVSMRWDHIRGDHMLVWVKKKDRHLQVAMLPELAERLARMEKKAVTILTNANGQPWTASGLRRKLQDWASERGHKVVPHGIRKNAVIALLEAGCTAAEVSGITDQSLAMVEHYARRVNKLTLGRAAVIKLDAARRAR